MPLFAPHRRTVAFTIVLVLAGAAVGVVNPLLIKRTFDTGLFVEGGPRLGRVWFLASLMVGFAVAGSALGLAQTWLTNRVGQQVLRDLRVSLFDHLQRLPLSFFTGTRTGEIQSRLTNDVGGVQGVLTSTLSSVLYNVVTFLSALVAMLALSWQLTAIAVATVPLFFGLSRWVGERRRRVAARTQERMAELTVVTEEALSVSGVLLSKVYHRHRDQRLRFDDDNRQMADLQVRQQVISNAFFYGIQVFLGASPAIIYLVSAYLLRSDPSITAGTVVAFTTLQTRLYFPVSQLLQVAVELRSSLAYFDRIFEYLDIEPSIVDAPDAVRPAKADLAGRVELRDVRFRYEAGSDHWNLDGVSLGVAPGQLAALVGPSGAGKTTVGYLVARLYDPESGAVLIDGIDLKDLAHSALSDAVGFVTQESYLFHATIAENLRYARPDATHDELVEACRMAAIHDRISEFPDAYDTVVGERGYRLSGGEKQRLAIARAILHDPRILILDEATSALDTASERLVQEALTRLMAGRTTIAIAHRLSTIRAADVIYGIADGRVVEAGTHDELLAAGGLYATLYREQFGGGLVECRTADAIRLTNGAVLPLHEQAAAAGD